MEAAADMQMEFYPKRSSKTKLAMHGFYYLMRFCAFAGCVAALVLILVTCHVKLQQAEQVQVADSTEDADRTKLEITLCPVPPFDAIACMNFGTYHKVAVYLKNKFEYDLFFRQYWGNAYASYYKALVCLHTQMLIQRSRPIEERLKVLGYFPYCLGNNHPYHENVQFGGDPYKGQWATWNMTNETILDTYDWFFYRGASSYLFLDQEHPVDEYDRIYESIGILKHDNETTFSYIDGIASDIQKASLSYFTDDMDMNLVGPSQELQMTIISTRFGHKCRRYAFSSGQRKLHQRYELRTTFHGTDNAYILVFINEHGQFTDIPGAGGILPYRVSMNRDTLLHVREMERMTYNSLPGRQCKEYAKTNGTRVNCMEKCILAKIVEDNNRTCIMPWMLRITPQYLGNREFCDTFSRLNETYYFVNKVLQSKSTDCRLKCPKACTQLTIAKKVMGVHRSSASTARATNHMLIVIVSNILDITNNVAQYDRGQQVSEMLGTISFILGIAFVAGIDWLFSVLFWMCGKLPYIPTMPPLINTNIYPRTIINFLRWELFGDPMPEVQSQYSAFIARSVEPATSAAQVSSSQVHSDVSLRQRRRAGSIALPARTDHDIAPRTMGTTRSFPVLHQRKSSMAFMSETILALSNRRFPRQSSSSEAQRAGRPEPVGPSRSAFLRPSASTAAHSGSAAGPHGVRSSHRDVPAQLLKPRITISAAKEPRRTSTPVVSSSLLPDIDRERRPSRAASILQQLETAESVPTPVPTSASALLPAAGGPRRASLYPSRPRRKIHPTTSVKQRDSGHEPPG